VCIYLLCVLPVKLSQCVVLPLISMALSRVTHLVVGSRNSVTLQGCRFLSPVHQLWTPFPPWGNLKSPFGVSTSVQELGCTPSALWGRLERNPSPRGSPVANVLINSKLFSKVAGPSSSPTSSVPQPHPNLALSFLFLPSPPPSLVGDQTQALL
jgi:hypothetical protein